MLKDQVAFLLQKYLGNDVRGLSAEALKISVWQGDVELTNMQLKPEALNALKLPTRVNAGFLGSVRLKVPCSRLGQEPVQVYLDRIRILVEPAIQVVGCYEDGLLKAKKNLVREMERKVLEARQHQKVEVGFYVLIWTDGVVSCRSKQAFWVYSNIQRTVKICLD